MILLRFARRKLAKSLHREPAPPKLTAPFRLRLVYLFVIRGRFHGCLIIPHRGVASIDFNSAQFAYRELWAGPKPDTAGTKPQVLYLHTEFLPYKGTGDNSNSNRLSREIVRQALLVAAHDGMGLQTCDETLQELPPDDAEVVQLLLTERSTRDGKWHIKLTKFVEGQT